MNLCSMRLLNSLLKKSCVVIMIMALCILCGCAASESRSEYGIFIGVDPDDLPEDMKDYDIIVIDAQNFTRGQIQKFKNNGQKVYSYINAGSIEKTRSYYGKYADLTLDPYEIGTKNTGLMYHQKSGRILYHMIYRKSFWIKI